jgi:hypothetical protein
MQQRRRPFVRIQLDPASDAAKAANNLGCGFLCVACGLEVIGPYRRVSLLDLDMPEPAMDSEDAPFGRLHRVSRLMALAIKLESLLQQQTLRDYSAIAALGGISKARVTQIMNLLNLAPDIQEQLLFLPPTTRRRDKIGERQLRAIAKVVDWSEQRRLFHTVGADAVTEVPRQ